MPEVGTSRYDVPSTGTLRAWLQRVKVAAGISIPFRINSLRLIWVSETQKQPLANSLPSSVKRLLAIVVKNCSPKVITSSLYRSTWNPFTVSGSSTESSVAWPWASALDSRVVTIVAIGGCLMGFRTLFPKERLRFSQDHSVLYHWNRRLFGFNRTCLKYGLELSHSISPTQSGLLVVRSWGVASRMLTTDFKYAPAGPQGLQRTFSVQELDRGFQHKIGFPTAHAGGPILWCVFSRATYLHF